MMTTLMRFILVFFSLLCSVFIFFRCFFLFRSFFFFSFGDNSMIIIWFLTSFFLTLSLPLPSHFDSYAVRFHPHIICYFFLFLHNSPNLYRNRQKCRKVLYILTLLSQIYFLFSVSVFSIRFLCVCVCSSWGIPIVFIFRMRIIGRKIYYFFGSAGLSVWIPFSGR